jgi:hypothetical protein
MLRLNDFSHLNTPPQVIVVGVKHNTVTKKATDFFLFSRNKQRDTSAGAETLPGKIAAPSTIHERRKKG